MMETVGEASKLGNGIITFLLWLGLVLSLCIGSSINLWNKIKTAFLITGIGFSFLMSEAARILEEENN